MEIQDYVNKIKPITHETDINLYYPALAGTLKGKLTIVLAKVKVYNPELYNDIVRYL